MRIRPSRRVAPPQAVALPRPQAPALIGVRADRRVVRLGIADPVVRREVPLVGPVVRPPIEVPGVPAAIAAPDRRAKTEAIEVIGATGATGGIDRRVHR